MVMDESYLPDIHDFTAASYWLATFLIVCVTVVFFVKSIFLQRAQLACRWDSIIAYFTYIPILGHLIVYITCKPTDTISQATQPN